MQLECLDIIGSNKIRELAPDQFMRIVTEQLPAGNVDLGDSAIFIDAGVPDGREVIKIGVPDA